MRVDTLGIERAAHLVHLARLELEDILSNIQPIGLKILSRSYQDTDKGKDMDMDRGILLELVEQQQHQVLQAVLQALEERFPGLEGIQDNLQEEDMDTDMGRDKQKPLELRQDRQCRDILPFLVEEAELGQGRLELWAQRLEHRQQEVERPWQR